MLDHVKIVVFWNSCIHLIVLFVRWRLYAYGVLIQVLPFVDKEASCCSTHLIEGDGTFNGEGLDNFIKEVKLAECGLSYAVVAIMGPQSSGMSFIYWDCIICKFWFHICDREEHTSE